MDTNRTQAETGRTHGGQSLETQLERTQGGQGRHMADIRCTKFGGAATADSNTRAHIAWTRQSLETWPSRTQDMVDTCWFGGAAKADTRRTQADRWRTHGRHMADKVWRHGHRGLKADTGQTQGGHMVDKVWRRGQSGLKVDKADTWRTSSRNAARAYRGQPFFS